MTPLVMAELISGVFVFVSLVSQFTDRDRSKSAVRLRLCSFITLFWLIIDALSYLVNGEKFPFAVLFIINLISFCTGCLVFISFMRYCDAYIKEKTELNDWIFRLPIILLSLNAAAIAVYFSTGNMYEYKDGVMITETLPPVLSAVFVITLMYMPIVAFTKRIQIGTKPMWLLGFFCLAPIIGVIAALYTGDDYSVVLGSLALMIVVTFLQNQENRQKMEKAREAAEAASKAKTTFLFNMSHDIRTPMNAILGFADVALRHSDDAERVNDSIVKIKLSGGHLLSLINDILEMSRIEAGKLELVESPIYIYDAIASVNQMSQSLAIPKSIDLKTVTGDIKYPYIMADELHVNEVLINIISNAVKYTNPGGKVTYITEQTGEAKDGFINVRFTVSDNGIGMSEEFQKHLFEDFSRENSSTVSKQEGAGLGLSIVKKIVDMAEGTITVHSVKDEGSTFIIDIPMRIMDEETQISFKESHEKHTVIQEDAVVKGRKVLLVEDNEMNREIATDVLEETGMDVDTAEDGAIAVRRVMDKGVDYYDFILMDIQMPVMDGYEATAEIRKIPGGDKVKIIALSANAFKEDMDKSLNAGMDAHVAKPFDITNLLNTMHKLSK